MAVITAAVATIIGSILAAGTAITGAAIDSKNVDEANRIGLQTYNQERADKLKNEEYQKSINRWEMRQRGKEFKQGIVEFKQGVKERKAAKEFGQGQTAMQNTLGLVNQNAQLRDLFLKTSMRRAA